MDSPEITIQDRALDQLLEIRDRESDAEDLALLLRISGINGSSFAYEMALMRVDDATDDDYVIRHDRLPIIVPLADLENLRGMELKMSRDLLNPGLTIDNPNSPSPTILGGGAPPDLTGPVAEQVQQVVSGMINPSIASHGGFVEVVAVEDETAYVRLGGGCQGCGMASVTLSQGIESTITSLVPEITQVTDVTDHASGTNPYYEQSKK